MKCKSCGNLINKDDLFCSKCGTKVKKINNLYFIIPIILVILIIIFSIISGNRRIEVLDNINTEHLTFKVLDDELTIGDKVSAYVDKGYTYVSDDSYVSPDSISIATFSKDDKPLFLALIYCPSKKKCSIEESKIVKINFYKDSKVVIEDKIKYGMTYEEIKKILGEETGRFYMDENYYVWSFGNEIGSPYYIVRFDEGGWFSFGGSDDIRMGVWWYEDESIHSIIKKGVTKDEK